MGTTCTNKPKGMPLEQFFIEHGVLRWSDDAPHRYQVLASSYKAPCFYAAVEQVHKETGERRVWAAVIKITYSRDPDGYGFCYKDMDESMGPCYYDCPAKVLDLLTPTLTEHKYARAWRAECRKRLDAQATKRATLAPGVVLYYGGHDYTLIERLPKGYWRVSDENGYRYRMRPGQVRAASLKEVTA